MHILTESKGVFVFSRNSKTFQIGYIQYVFSNAVAAHPQEHLVFSMFCLMLILSVEVKRHLIKLNFHI